jgi:hypothetical protein
VVRDNPEANFGRLKPFNIAGNETVIIPFIAKLFVCSCMQVEV